MYPSRHEANPSAMFRYTNSSPSFLFRSLFRVKNPNRNARKDSPAVYIVLCFEDSFLQDPDTDSKQNEDLIKKLQIMCCTNGSQSQTSFAAPLLIRHDLGEKLTSKKSKQDHVGEEPYHSMAVKTRKF